MKASKKLIGLFLTYLLGVVSVPKGWNFWKMTGELGRNPDFSVTLLNTMAVITITIVVVLVLIIFVKND